MFPTPLMTGFFATRVVSPLRTESCKSRKGSAAVLSTLHQFFLLKSDILCSHSEANLKSHKRVYAADEIFLMSTGFGDEDLLNVVFDFVDCTTEVGSGPVGVSPSAARDDCELAAVLYKRHVNAQECTMELRFFITTGALKGFARDSSSL